ncbi:hypothetical protein MRX96_036914 [Rhipicephalus microplus]
MAASTKTVYDPSTMQWVDIKVAETRSSTSAPMKKVTLGLWLSCALTLMQLVSGASRQQRLVAVSLDVRENRLVAHNDSSAKDVIAVCAFSDSRLDFGWASVFVKTDGRFKDSQQAYAAGYAEGSATSLMTDQHYANIYGNYCDSDPTFCNRLFAFYRANLQSLLENAVQYGDKDPFWHQVELAILQISGMQRGLTGATSIRYDPHEVPTDFERLVLLNLYKDVGDLEWAFGMRGKKGPRDPGVAFFKTTTNSAEAIAAHASWGHYSGMNKLLKKYVFNYKLVAGSGQPVPATALTFSGYPGSVSSGDDFFLTSKNLAVLGTGIRNQNSDLWSRLTPDNTVPSAFRSLAASRLAESAKEWIHTYSRGSAGTGNSQWTVIDYNLFKPRMKKLPQDFVWYHEELPGYSVSADVTSVVENQGYWASYNIPFFSTIYNVSGMPKLSAEHGDWFTYDKCPRALMFKRGAKEPSGIEQVLDFVRCPKFLAWQALLLSIALVPLATSLRHARVSPATVFKGYASSGWASCSAHPKWGYKDHSGLRGIYCSSSSHGGMCTL